MSKPYPIGTIYWSQDEMSFVGVAADGETVLLGPGVGLGLIQYLIDNPDPTDW